MKLVAPLGIGSVLNKANDFGKVVVGTQLGPVPMALYTTAAYQVPLVNIVQTSLSDVIFPDMVKRAQRDPHAGFALWRRAQTLIFAVICPAWLLLTYFAEPLIRVGVHRGVRRRDALLPGVPAPHGAPVFPVLGAVAQRRRQRLVRHLERGRARDQRGVHHRADAALRIVGSDARSRRRPDVDVGVSRARALLKRYNLPLSELCQWGKLGLALAASLVALAALYGTQTAIDGRAGALAGLGVFALVYVIAARLILREEYGYIVRALSRRPVSLKRGA